MQCLSCLKTFAETLSVCPSCGAMPTRHDLQAEAVPFCPLPDRANSAAAVTVAMRSDTGAAATLVLNAAVVEPKAELKKTMKREFTSTLIEFPKRERNEWRDEVREKVREARERRGGSSTGGASSEAERSKAKRANRKEASKAQAESAASSSGGSSSGSAPATVINLKPNLEEQPKNRLIARALERVERSRQVHDANGFSSAAFPATAFAPAFQPEEEGAENFVADDLPSPARTARPFSVVSNSPERVAETESADATTAPREIETLDFDANDAAETAATSLKIETESQTENLSVGFEAPTIEPKKEPRKLPVTSEADLDSIIESQLPRVSGATPARKPSPRSGGSLFEQEIAPRDLRAPDAEEIAEDYAPLGVRFAAGLLDALACAAGTAVLFAIFAPTGFFAEGRFNFTSALTILSVFAALKFFYLTATLTLAETTPAGVLFSLRVVHAEDGSAPTVFESAVNSIIYLLTLATAGIGFLAILFSTEKRALHDLAAGTVVIREN